MKYSSIIIVTLRTGRCELCTAVQVGPGVVRKQQCHLQQLYEFFFCKFKLISVLSVFSNAFWLKVAEGPKDCHIVEYCFEYITALRSPAMFLFVF